MIQIEGARRSYELGDEVVHALRDVTLRIEAGEHVAIMGPSGSGKSTLMNVIGCLDQLNEGRYLLDGIDVRDRADDELAEIRNRKIGFIFQQFNLIARTSALENVELPLVYAGVGRRERRRRAHEALDQVGLGDRTGHQPSELSGGQQQRVAIARAIVTDPALLLADEPTGALDLATTEAVMALLDELHEQGRTIVVITHEEEVGAHAARVVRVRDGLIDSDLPAWVEATA
ncbi:MAG: ABC transporter ATP-binding protein [Actinobacteria bacterium]|nr:ABC transporter ATP-binding protein [Actinomycetota bacterium]MBS1882585.1 ABC transporter ATP-binding protein [Actinomycetota bacterium]